MSRIVLSSGGVNRHGYRIIPEGIVLENYLKNPVLLGFHNDYKLPIGILKDIKIEDGKLTGEPVFDEKDEEALKFKQKYEDGFLRAVSIYHIPLLFSSEPHLLLPGQTGETVVKTELIEVSFVSIGSDPDAHALNFDMNKLNIPLISNQKNSIMELTKVQRDLRNKLGLPETASDEDVNTAVQELLASRAIALNAQIDTMLALGKQKGFITDENEESYRKLAAKDFLTVEKIITDHKAPEGPTETKLSLNDIVKVLKGTSNQADDDDKNTFAYLERHDPAKLNMIRKDEPEKYRALVDAHVKGKI